MSQTAAAPPVAWGIFDSQGFYESEPDEATARRFCERYNKRPIDPLKPYTFAPLYATPPAAPEPLTDDEVRSVYRKVFDSPFAPRIYGLAEQFARAIERAHGIGAGAQERT